MSIVSEIVETVSSETGHQSNVGSGKCQPDKSRIGLTITLRVWLRARISSKPNKSDNERSIPSPIQRIEGCIEFVWRTPNRVANSI